ncbi:MAG: hypothetical protein AAGI72_12800 [Pseudomonadota bacterium]
MKVTLKTARPAVWLGLTLSLVAASASSAPFVEFSISGTGQSSGFGFNLGNTAIDTFETNNPGAFDVDLNILFDAAVSGTEVDPGVFRFGANAISSIDFSAGDSIFSGLNASAPQPITVTILDPNGNPIEVPLLDVGNDPSLFVFDNLDAGNGTTVDGFQLNLDINTPSDFVGASTFPTNPLVSNLFLNFFVTDDVFDTSNGFDLLSLADIDGSSLNIITDPSQAPNSFSLLAFDPSGVIPNPNIIPGPGTPFPFISGLDLYLGDLSFDPTSVQFRTADVVSPLPTPTPLALVALGLVGLGSRRGWRGSWAN